MDTVVNICLVYFALATFVILRDIAVLTANAPPLPRLGIVGLSVTIPAVLIYSGLRDRTPPVNGEFLLWFFAILIVLLTVPALIFCAWREQSRVRRYAALIGRLLIYVGSVALFFAMMLEMEEWSATFAFASLTLGLMLDFTAAVLPRRGTALVVFQSQPSGIAASAVVIIGLVASVISIGEFIVRLVT